MSEHTGPRRPDLSEAPELNADVPEWARLVQGEDLEEDAARQGTRPENLADIPRPAAPVTPRSNGPALLGVKPRLEVAQPVPMPRPQPSRPEQVTASEGSNREVAVVAPNATYTALAYLPVPWNLHHFETAHAFFEALTDQDVNLADLDGVIMVDTVAGRDTEEVLNRAVAATMLNRVPTALIATSDNSMRAVADHWPVLENMLDTWWAGQPDHEQGVSPSQTDLVVVSHTRGARDLVAQFGPSLRRPFIDVTIERVAADNFGKPLPLGSGPTSNGSGVRKGSIISVTSAKGGSGKTSVSLMLAATIEAESRAAGRPLRVVVIDADKQSQLFTLFNSDPGSGLAHLRDNSTYKDVETQLHTPLPDQFPNLQVLRGGTDPNSHRGLRTAPLYGHVLEVLASKIADVVVVDLSVDTVVDEVSRTAMQMSDQVCYVVSPEVTSMVQARQTVPQMLLGEDEGGLALNPRQVHLVYNKVNQGARDAWRDFEQARRADFPQVSVLGEVPPVEEWAWGATSGEAFVTLAATDPRLTPVLQPMVQVLLPGQVYVDTPTAHEAANKPAGGWRRLFGR